MLILSDSHVSQLQDLFKRFEDFENNYNLDSNHYPSTIWLDIHKFCKDVNEYNVKIDVSKLKLP